MEHFHEVESAEDESAESEESRSSEDDSQSASTSSASSAGGSDISEQGSEVDVVEALDRPARQRKRHEEAAAAHGVEWDDDDVGRIAAVGVFSGCADVFLLALAKLAEPRLCFIGHEICPFGMRPSGILQLSSGVAEEVTEQGLIAGEIASPQSIGTLEWLGILQREPLLALRAKTLCHTLRWSKETVLKALRQHPFESTAMVQHALQEYPLRLSITQGLQYRRTSSPSGPRGLSALPSGEQVSASVDRWHRPFCRGCNPSFILDFRDEMEVCQLIPGQPLFAPSPTRGFREQPDFVVVLVAGAVRVDEQIPQARRSWADLYRPKDTSSAPIIVVGFNRQHTASVMASTVCEVHRLSIRSCETLAARHPDNLRLVLQRMIAFQEARDPQLGSQWWQTTTSLRQEEWFRDSPSDFLVCLKENLKTEIYLPGEVLVREGDPVDSTMLLECGNGAVEKVDPRGDLWVSYQVGEIHDGYWIGEMAMFAGESKRRATVRARSVCKVQRLYHKELVQLLMDNRRQREKFRELAEQRLRAVEKERLEDYDFFKDFDRTFLNLLRPKCKAKVFFAGEVLMKQGEVADSLFILGSDACISLEVDGVEVRKVAGRACLGTKALLSRRAVRRASTVITQTVCATRMLTRDDWFEVLKLHPEYLKWLAPFSREQISKVSELRCQFLKERAWVKIHQRETAARAKHTSRIATADPAAAQRRDLNIERSLLRSQANADHQILSRASDTQAQQERQLKWQPQTPPQQQPFLLPLDPQHGERLASPELWPCFNGNHTTVPHTRLPMLQQHGAGDAAGEAQTAADQDRGSTRSSYSHGECEEALGALVCRLPSGRRSPASAR